MGRRRTKARTITSTISRVPAPAAPPLDQVRVAIDLLIVVAGLAIIARGVAGQHGVVYEAAGAIFLAFGLWRLTQMARDRLNRR